MNKRSFVRYGSEVLPGSLSKATLAWEDSTLNGVYVVNYSATGVSVVVPPFLDAPVLPKDQGTIKILLPFSKEWFTGSCAYVNHEKDGSVCMGIHITDPKEQSCLQQLLCNSLNTPARSHSFVSYEWEELVGKLCDSDDPSLQEIGQQYLAVIRAKQAGLQPPGVST